MRGCNRLAYQQPLAQQPRQLADICSNPLRLVAAEQSWPPTAGRARPQNKRGPALLLALSLSFSAVVWDLRCSYTPILPTKRPKRPRIADDGKYIEKFFRHPFSFVRGD